MGNQTVNKQVRFTAPTIFYIRDTVDYIESRKIYWELFALDRQRFKERIDRVKLVLEPVLSIEHYTCVMKRNGRVPL